MVTTGDGIEPPVAFEVLSRAREGDAEAFCALIEPLQGRLLRQAAAMTGELSAAEDLVSEALVEAWKSLRRYDETCRLSTWLYSILLHRWQKALRRAKARPISMSRLSANEAAVAQKQHDILPSYESSPSEAAIQDELLRDTMRCVESLPLKHKEVILLRFFEDASLAEIALAVDCSVGTVKSRLHHALENLRKLKMNLPHPKGDEHI